MSEDTNLTLPGLIPGLLRRGSPVIHVDGRHGVAVEIVPEYDGNQPVAWLMPHDQDPDCCPNVADIALNLTDATGRAHAAWWLARQETVAGREANLARYPDWRPFYAGDRRWGLEQWGPMFVPSGSGGVVVPALAEIDPTDLCLLPDGSRRVDAEALRRVCLHVAGLPLI